MRYVSPKELSPTRIWYYQTILYKYTDLLLTLFLREIEAQNVLESQDRSVPLDNQRTSTDGPEQDRRPVSSTADMANKQN